jgi:hypothetical protein
MALVHYCIEPRCYNYGHTLMGSHTLFCLCLPLRYLLQAYSLIALHCFFFMVMIRACIFHKRLIIMGSLVGLFTERKGRKGQLS